MELGRQEGAMGTRQRSLKAHPANRPVTSEVGPIEIDWPRSVGYFVGIGLAVALEVISPPIGLFLAAIPFVKMLNRAEVAIPPAAGRGHLSPPRGATSHGPSRRVPAPATSTRVHMSTRPSG